MTKKLALTVSSSIATASLILISLEVGSLAEASTVILESNPPLETLNSDYFIGYNYSETVFTAWKFQVDAYFQVTDIGGNLYSQQAGIFGDPKLIGNEKLFAAIVQLDSFSSLPKGSPFLPEEVLAVTTFDPGYPASEVIIPLSITLQPGTYSLVFGSGIFGASGSGGLSIDYSLFNSPTNNPENYFSWSDGRWGDASTGNSPNGTRFVVKGSFVGLEESVPEPSTIFSLLAIGAFGGSSLLKHKLKQ